MMANGKSVFLGKEVVLSQWLESQGYSPDRTAVLLNGNVVPRTSMRETVISDSDCLEIVGFVGGG